MAGRRAVQGAVGKAPELPEVGLGRRVEEQNLMNQLGAQIGLDPNNMGAFVGNRSADMRTALGNLQQTAQAARTRSADMAGVLGRMQGGLDGYTQQQMQQMRESQGREMRAQMQGDLEAAQAAQGRSRVLGAAGMAQQDAIRRAGANTAMQLEQDLQIKSADEAQKRLGEYGQFLGGLEESEFGRRASADQAFAAGIGSAENDEFQRVQSQQQNLAGLLGQTGQQEIARAGQVAGVRGDRRAADVAEATGGAGLIGVELARRDQNKQLGIGGRRQSRR